MKRILLFIALPLLVSACGLADRQKNTESRKTFNPRDGVAEEIGIANLPELLTEAMVRQSFDIPDSIQVKMTTKESICSYEWEGQSENKNLILNYSVSLNFGNKEEMDNAAIDRVWQRQNKSIYKQKDVQEVKGVGDRASWSSLGGGQLRVAAKGNLFYLSLSSHKIDRTDALETMDDQAWSKELMIIKSKELASGIISKLE